MAGSDTLTVRLGAELSEFVAWHVGEDGTYMNVSEYIRDLIRHDRARVEDEMFPRLKAELQKAFAAPESDYHPLSLEDIIGHDS